MKKLTQKLNSRPTLFLLVGFVLMTFSHMNYSISLFAWVAMTPFLIYLQQKRTAKSKFYFALVLIAAWSAITYKIITDPIPIFLVFLYAIPIALIHFPGYLIWSKIQPGTKSALIFAAVMTIMEWIQYTFTPLGSWGAAAYTQIGNPGFLQGLSIGGTSLISFILYWFNAELAVFLIQPSKKTSLVYPVSILVIVTLFGHARISMMQSVVENTVKVAAVSTNSTIGGLPLTPFEDNQKDIQMLMEDTRVAAKSGAELVVWNEASFYLLPENEAQWVDSLRELSRKSGITLAAAYVVPISIEPFQYKNKLVVINEIGDIQQEYLKHEPVPGEPAVKGREKVRSLQKEKYNLGAAICYDYDFPYLARAGKNAGADIIALPSSDWLGIDPLHTQMAAFRAIENGFSIVRSTRFGLSAAIDPIGEFRAQKSSFDSEDRIMIADLPVSGSKTFYSLAGDYMIYISIMYLAFLVALELRKRIETGSKKVNTELHPVKPIP